MSNLLQDIRYGIRVLRKNPGYTLIAVLALALGIAGVSVEFSAVDAVLLRPMAYKDLDRLVVVWTTLPKQNITQSSTSPADFLDWASQNTVFHDMAAEHGWEVNLSGQGDPERLQGAEVTSNYFGVLGVNPTLGRTFAPADAANGGARVVLLTYNLWKRRFAADPQIVGKVLTLNAENYSVIGVMGEDVDSGEDLWRPLGFTPKEGGERGNHYLDVVARLKPGASVRQAQAELKTIAARLERQYPATNAGTSTDVQLFRESLTFGTRQYVLTLLGAAIFVLLLACANVANLQLARALARQKEMAVRTALGATKWRLVQQILVESAMLGIVGGFLGLLLAAWGIDLTKSVIPASVMRVLTVLRHIELDTRVVAFTVAISISAGLLTGLIAALHAARANVSDALKEGGRSEGAGSGRSPIRATLVITEVALALVLLVGAGLMVRGFRNLLVFNQGYEPKGILALNVSLVRSQYPEPSRRLAFFERVISGLRSVPGVEAAASTSALPAGGRGWNSNFFRIEGRAEPAPDERMLTATPVVSPNYLRAMQIPLRAGRFFDGNDRPQTTPVVVINTEMVRRYWPNQNPVGQRVRFLGDDPAHWRTIVGVVGDVKRPFDHSFRPMTYSPLAQSPTLYGTFVVRTAGDPLALAAATREQIRQADPDQAVYDMRTLESVIGDQISGVRIASQMMMVFAVIALLLAGAGIYAVMAYAVEQRTHEIGVRMALGASQRAMLKMIILQACKLAGIGSVIGAAGTVVVSRTLSSILFGVLDLEPLTFGALLALLGAIAVLAGYIPARRASRLEPMVALRYE